MPNSQADFPLTLAEVLFDELEHTLEQTHEYMLKLKAELAEQQKGEPSERVAEDLEKIDKRILEYGKFRSQTAWTELADEIEEIRELPTKGRKELVSIC